MAAPGGIFKKKENNLAKEELGKIKTMNDTNNKILIISENAELKQDFLETLGNQNYQVILSMAGRDGVHKIEECIPDPRKSYNR